MPDRVSESVREDIRHGTVIPAPQQAEAIAQAQGAANARPGCKSIDDLARPTGAVCPTYSKRSDKGRFGKHHGPLAGRCLFQEPRECLLISRSVIGSLKRPATVVGWQSYGKSPLI